jgi:hypothetical protein
MVGAGGIMFLFLPILALAGCADTLLPHWDRGPRVDPGSISGRVCSSSGAGWLQDALVYTHVVDGGRILQTSQVYTDPDGRWLIDDLPGELEYDIFVYDGPTALEDQMREGIWLADGAAVELAEPLCIDPSQLRVAVVSGTRDEIEPTLTGIGLTAIDRVDGLDSAELLSFLSDLDSLRAYDIVFFEGGHEEDGIVTLELVQENLRVYVEAGGSLFASDQAYDLVEQSWPEKLDFLGDDGRVDAAQLGEPGVINAAVSDASLAHWLDADHLEFGYAMPEWAPVERVDTDAVSVHLKGNVSHTDGELSQVPLLVSFGSGDGRVVYSSFGVADNDSEDLRRMLRYLLFAL